MRPDAFTKAVRVEKEREEFWGRSWEEKVAKISLPERYKGNQNGDLEWWSFQGETTALHCWWEVTYYEHWVFPEFSSVAVISEMVVEGLSGMDSEKNKGQQLETDPEFCY
jgi:hypothetical protein